MKEICQEHSEELSGEEVSLTLIRTSLMRSRRKYELGNLSRQTISHHLRSCGQASLPNNQDKFPITNVGNDREIPCPIHQDNFTRLIPLFDQQPYPLYHTKGMRGLV